MIDNKLRGASVMKLLIMTNLILGRHPVTAFGRIFKLANQGISTSKVNVNNCK